jgi:hypothetical protein
MIGEPCSICGGDGRIGNAFGGSSTTCPSCHGSGQRAETTGFHDVTKTKQSHYGPTNRVAVVAKTRWPVTSEGGLLATEVKESTICTEVTKAKLIQDIIDHEGVHGLCTKTFIKKVRQQVRPKMA